LKYSDKNRHDSAIKTLALFIPSLDIGGAERQVLELAKVIDKAKWKVFILTDFVSSLVANEVISMSGVDVILLEKGSKYLYPLRLLKALNTLKPHILNAYLLKAQIYTLIIRPFISDTIVIFSIRDAMDYSVYHGSRGSLFRVLVEKFSPLVNGYIFNSFAGRELRSSIPPDKAYIIPNGIDTNRFAPDYSGHNHVKNEIGIGDDQLVIGIVANFSQYKGYETFIRAARIIADKHPNTQFVSIGNIKTSLGEEMRQLVNNLALTSRFHFLGARSDVNRLIPGFDIFCSASITEGFANAICEAMSCGKPCVVTDVGDSAVIIGDTGIVVPPSDPESLAAGIVKLLHMSPTERHQLGDKARSRIEKNFGIPRMVAATEKVYELLMESH